MGYKVTQTLPLTQVGYKVFLGRRKYFVSVDVGGGRIQWYLPTPNPNPDPNPNFNPNPNPNPNPNRNRNPTVTLTLPPPLPNRYAFLNIPPGALPDECKRGEPAIEFLRDECAP